ncbi:MAG: hypothetical protein JKY23_02345, partial [Nitrospinaceae bacterium]|nr:hypothetical protein [Nitrospinaceae bacterium]
TGIFNSVILGGQNITATQNNTVYTSTLDVNGTARISSLPTPIGSVEMVVADGSGNLFKQAIGGGGGPDADWDLTTFPNDMVSLPSGNVGIGTTVAPTEKLEVVGNAKINGTATITNLPTPIGSVEMVVADGSGNLFKQAIVGGGGDDLQTVTNVGNTTTNDIELTNSSLKSAGGSFLRFDFGGDNKVMWLQDGYSAGHYIYSDNTLLQLQHDQIDVGSKDIRLNGRGGENVFIGDIATASVSSINTNKTAALFINSRNSTFNTGIFNSVILGGENITATQNNTVYTSILDVNGTARISNLPTPVGSVEMVVADGSGNLFKQAIGGGGSTDADWDITTFPNDMVSIPSGNVGIGTTVAPTEKLEVVGNAKINGTATITNLPTPIGSVEMVVADVNGNLFKQTVPSGTANDLQTVLSVGNNTGGSHILVNGADDIILDGGGSTTIFSEIQWRSNFGTINNYNASIFFDEENESYLNIKSTTGFFFENTTNTARNILMGQTGEKSMRINDDFASLGLAFRYTGTGGDLVVASVSAIRTWTLPDQTGTIAILAGSTGQIQFNNGGVMGADANLFWDDTNKSLGIGTTTPDPEAALDVTSITSGFLPPRMSTTQRDNNITSPVAGLIIYNTTVDKHQGYNGTIWNNMY